MLEKKSAAFFVQHELEATKMRDLVRISLTSENNLARWLTSFVSTICEKFGKEQGSFMKAKSLEFENTKN